MISVFLQNLEAVFDWLVTASWQASVLVLLVLLVQWTLRGRLNPRWNHALWLLVVLRLVLPVLPASALSLFQFAPAPPPALTLPVTEPMFAAEPLSPAPDFTPDLPAPANPFSLLTLFALIWLTGALVLLVLTWQVNRRFGRQVKRSPSSDDPGLLKILDDAKAELGLHRPLRLIESTHVQGPAVMGLFHPTLLLPDRARDKFTDTDLRFIFLHELAHLKRGDLIVQWLVALLQILHWFNPVLWFAFRRMRADREPATDALVLSRTGEADKERYGLILIKLLEHFNQRHSLPTLVGILEDKDQFKQRFLQIGRFTRGAYGWSLLGVGLIALLSVACLTKSKAAATTTVSTSHSTTDVTGKNPAVMIRINQTVLDTPSSATALQTATLNQQLLDVVRVGWTDKVGKGDADKVAQLLAQGADPNAKDERGNSALTWALNFGKDDAAQLLIQHGADAGAQDQNGENAAWLASFIYYCPGALDLMIKKGVNVTALNKFKNSLFSRMTTAAPAKAGKMNYLNDRVWTDAEFQAYEQRERRIVDLLLGAGLDVNGRSGAQQKTPLMLAVQSGHLPMAMELIAHGADASLKDPAGDTALSLAQLWHPEYVLMLEAAIQKSPDNHTEIQSPNSPAAPADAASNPSPPTPSNQVVDDFVRVDVKLVSISEDDYQAHGSDIDDALKRGDVAPLAKTKSFDLLSEPAVLIKSGENGTLEAVRVFPFPVKFQNLNGKIAPTEFARRNIGVRLPISVVATGGKIDLTGRLEVTTFQGFVQSDDTQYEACFTTRETYFFQEVGSGQTTSVAIPGTEIEPSAVNGVPDRSRKLSRYFLFITAKSGLPGVASIPSAATTASPVSSSVAPAAATAIAAQSPPLDVKSTEAAPAQVRIDLKVVEIDDDVYLANKEKIDAGMQNDVSALFNFLNNLKGVSLLSTPSVSTMPGLKADIDIVREFPYPIKFDPAERVSTSGATVTIPTTPTDFAIKDVGIKTEITPSIDTESLSNHGEIILNGTFSVVNFDGFTRSNLGPQMPTFSTSETHFLEELDNGQIMGISIPGEHVALQNPTAANITPDWEKTAPMVKKRYLLFVSASLVK